MSKIKGVGIAVKGFGKAMDFASKRIAAMNRKIQRAHPKSKRTITEGYIEEYGDLQSTKAKNKKEYKAEQKAKREKFRKSLPKELPYDE